MKIIVKVLVVLFYILYVLLYIGYSVIINILHSSYSIISVTAVTLPFLLLLFYKVIKRRVSATNVHKSGKRRGYTAIILGSLLPLYCLFVLGINEYHSKFTIEKWQNNESTRVYMVDHLLKLYDFEKMTKSEVTELLGTPPETNYFKEDNNSVYYLGNERGLISIDSEWLIFYFDENLKVINIEIRRD